MSQASDHDAELLELTCNFRDLRVSVRGPPGKVSEVISALSSHFANQESTSSTASATSFEFAEPVPAPTDPPVLATPAVSVASSTASRDSISADFPPCPRAFLAQSHRLGGSSLSAVDRIKRAWVAGCWAKAVLENQISTPNRSVQLDLRPRFYAVLRAADYSGPYLCLSATTYWRLVGRIQENDSISHAFPSELEATIYFAGASAPDYQRLQ